MPQKRVKHICPKCGGKTFTTIAEVAQEWEVDEYGNFKSLIADAIDVVKGPSDKNIWTCVNCGSEAVIDET